MYAAVAIIPAASSFSQTRPIFHGVRKCIAYSTLEENPNFLQNPTRCIFCTLSFIIPANVQEWYRKVHTKICPVHSQET